MRKLFVLLFLALTSNVFAADVRLIIVTGSAEKTFKPDIARIYLSAWGKGESGKEAQTNSATQNEVIKKSLEAFKVKSEDVITTSYNLNPEYSYDPKTSKSNIAGYHAIQQITVVFRKIEDAGSFVDSLTSTSKTKKSGVDVNSFKFDLENEVREQNALLGDAVRASEAQAQVLAKAANVKLKGIYRLTPTNVSAPSMYMMADAAPRAKTEMATTFSPGEIKIKSDVSAEYLID